MAAASFMLCAGSATELDGLAYGEGLESVWRGIVRAEG